MGFLELWQSWIVCENGYRGNGGMKFEVRNQLELGELGFDGI